MAAACASRSRPAGHAGGGGGAGRADGALWPAAEAEAEVIVALGGDGFMLQTLHGAQALRLPVYGMNCGTIGFLMNDYAEEGLPERLARGGGGR